ncbi:plasma membrane calcium [Modicella reniformis]|uniref:Plasma membrane calcium n=1 Tax=Modicella reniformis TaxID=1440133 RepID=A0A9P6IMA1_9FUNG|nr:plasma membrane calcium [Modicella reniformis]
MDKSEIDPDDVVPSTTNHTSNNIGQQSIDTMDPNQPTSSQSVQLQHDTEPIPQRPNGPFAFTPVDLMTLIDPKSPEQLGHFGGTEGIIAGLHANIAKGLTTSGGNVPLHRVVTDEPEKQLEATEDEVDKTVVSFADREQYFGRNVLPKRKPKSIFELMWIALQEKILILLLIAAVVSIALGIYEDYGVEHVPAEKFNKDYTSYLAIDPKISWVEGVAILVAVIIVVMVGSINDFQKETQFRMLNAKKEDREVKVIRNGETVLISVFGIIVGDILHLEPGDVVAADGIYLGGHNLKCDESAMTGETDAVKKVTYDELKKMEEVEATARKEESRIQTNHEGIEVLHEPQHGVHGVDPFIISGAKVLEGVGTYVVTGVGPNSFHGKTMMSLRTEAEDTPLQVKLNDLAERIAKLGSMAALLMLIILFIRYFAGFRTGTPPSKDIVKSLVTIIISAVTVIVVAVPEGLPLAVTLALAFATTRMLRDNNLVRVLAACETMGNATTICSDKTGTLTQNK